MELSIESEHHQGESEWKWSRFDQVSFHTDDLSFFPVFSQLESNFLATVDRFFQFDQNLHWLWTYDDQCHLLLSKSHFSNYVTNARYSCYSSFSTKECKHVLCGISRKSCSDLLSTTTNSSEQQNEKQNLPRIRELCGQGVVQVAAGSQHVMARTRDGRLFAWGDNSHGQIYPYLQTAIFTPVLVLRKVRLVRCGPKHTAILDTSGLLWSWGLDHASHDRPMSIFGGDDHNKTSGDQTPLIIDVQCGQTFTIVLTSRHEVYLFGPRKFRSMDRAVRVEIAGQLPVHLFVARNSYFVVTTAQNCIFEFYPNDFEIIDIQDRCQPFPIDSFTALCGQSVFQNQSGMLLYFVDDFCATLDSSCFTSLPDHEQFYRVFGSRSTPDLTTITPQARTKLGDSFYACLTSLKSYLQSEQQSYLPRELVDRLIQARYKKHIPVHTIVSYCHYRCRGTFLDEFPLAWSLLALAYILQDVPLIARFAKMITTDLAHQYLCHRELFPLYLGWKLQRAFTGDIIDAYCDWFGVRKLWEDLTVNAPMDPSLQANQIRHLILRALPYLHEQYYFDNIVPVILTEEARIKKKICANKFANRPYDSSSDYEEEDDTIGYFLL